MGKAVKRIKYYLGKSHSLFRIYRFLYTFFAHHERLMKKAEFGIRNSESKILIIRPNSEDGIQGLMSLFVQTARWLQYADERGFLSYIDFETYKTQYYEPGYNAWDNFFYQPDGLTYDEVYDSKNVLISGVTIKKTIDDTMFREGVFKEKKVLSKCHSIIERKIRVSDEVQKLVDDENAILHVEDCIGIYLRGTDYVKLKPPGEFRQPEIDDVINKIREYIKKYPGKKLFLVTEDENYYKRLVEEFPTSIVTVTFDSFISGYDGKDFLSRTNLLDEDKKIRGMNYLVKIILLSRCRYLISSMTMGSIAAYCFNGGKYYE